MTFKHSLLAAVFASSVIAGPSLAFGNSAGDAPTSNVRTPAVHGPATNSKQPTTGQPGWPVGMADMLGQPEQVWATMGTAVRQGQGAPWLTWMRPGLADGGSMYWWLLSDWWAGQGQHDQAYLAAVQAYVWTRIDEVQCTGTSRSVAKRVITKTIQDHPILVQHQDAKLFHRAVLAAVDRAQTMIQNGKPGLGMMCLRGDILAARERAATHSSGGRSGSAMTISTPSAARVRGLLAQQASVLSRLKTELGYDKAWENTSINEAWSSIKPDEP